MTPSFQQERRLTWHKSSYSHNDGDCVETASTPGAVVAVRDTKALSAGNLAIPNNAWTRLTAALKN
ncbi:DUF397 domain-containing protein [Streptomyces sp. SID3343]|uniref:DUF397 domain-containing protein n=1 Tax=Streptomyces sp. SID3343 TaxID=2690260 RepID=UPI00136EE915|nr:DUF397 domain-containing protein [Streptomyces sp. SID3343]MYW03189.1 DUF397 domain-containing protein [Streptomyces sp. SID3343]